MPRTTHTAAKKSSILVSAPWTFRIGEYGAIHRAAGPELLAECRTLNGCRTGVYGYPKEEAATLAVAAVKTWLSQNASYEIEIIFSCFDQRTAELYGQALC